MFIIGTGLNARRNKGREGNLISRMISRGSWGTRTWEKTGPSLLSSNPIFLAEERKVRS